MVLLFSRSVLFTSICCKDIGIAVGKELPLAVGSGLSCWKLRVKMGSFRLPGLGLSLFCDDDVMCLNVATSNQFEATLIGVKPQLPRPHKFAVTIIYQIGHDVVKGAHLNMVAGRSHDGVSARLEELAMIVEYQWLVFVGVMFNQSRADDNVEFSAEWQVLNVSHREINIQVILVEDVPVSCFGIFAQKRILIWEFAKPVAAAEIIKID